MLLPSVASSMVLMLHTICLANHHRIPHPKLLAPLFFGRRTSETDSCKVPSLFIMKIKGIIIFRSSSVIGNFRLQGEIPDDLVLDFRKKDFRRYCTLFCFMSLHPPLTDSWLPF